MGFYTAYLEGLREVGVVVLPGEHEDAAHDVEGGAHEIVLTASKVQLQMVKSSAECAATMPMPFSHFCRNRRF